MRIIQFVTSLDDGGAETIVKDYAINLYKRNEEVFVVTVADYRESSNYRLVNDMGISIIPVIKGYNLFTRVFLKYFGWFYIPYKLNNIVSEINPDVIHVHLELLRYVEKISRKMGQVKICFTCHSEPEKKLGNTYPKELLAARNLSKTTDFQVIALHDEMRQKLNQIIGIDNTVVLHNCIDVKRFKNVDRNIKSSVRKEVGISEDAIVLGHIGRFSYPKNHEYLVEIAASVIAKNNKAVLLLIGDGGLLPTIKEKVSTLGITDKVIFLSHRSDIPELLKAIDVFLFPSRYEGFPVTLIEVQSSGVPCIASDLITKEALVSDNIYAMSINESPESWATSAINIIGKEQTECNVDQFDIEEIINRLLTIYKQRKDAYGN